jgi:hypothetical protein
MIQDVSCDLNEERVIDVKRLSRERQDRQRGDTQDQQDRGASGQLMGE